MISLEEIILREADGDNPDDAAYRMALRESYIWYSRLSPEEWEVEHTEAKHRCAASFNQHTAKADCVVLKHLKNDRAESRKETTNG